MRSRQMPRILAATAETERLTQGLLLAIHSSELPLVPKGYCYIGVWNKLKLKSSTIGQNERFICNSLATKFVLIANKTNAHSRIGYE